MDGCGRVSLFFHISIQVKMKSGINICQVVAKPVGLKITLMKKKSG
jgi:hypothetical protein